MKRTDKTMKCTILRWLLGIWLVETVAARHILNGEDTGNKQSRSGRDQFHPFYQQSPHLNYNSFRSSLRRAPPQVPGRRNLNEQEAYSHDQQHYNNYFANNQHAQNQQNLNVYSAVRLHGALEARARNEPGSNTLLPTTSQHVNYYHPQQSSRQPGNRHWRRDEETVDGESFERDGSDDLARFSLYNSYFDNEHSIKALNSMKCVTPTGSPGFCSTFRGCVPSFFTKEGDLEAPALAELISTSIGYCTTNVSHHFIREQRQQQFAYSSSREERRFNSVANRIICCPGVAPVRDPNLDPDKIFTDYIENQKLKTTTTTTPPAPEESENVVDGSSDNNENVPSSDPVPIQDANPEATAEESIDNNGQSSNQDGSQSVADSQQVQQPVQPEDNKMEVKPPVSEASLIIPEQAQTEIPESVSGGESQQQEQASPDSMTHPSEENDGVSNQQQVENMINKPVVESSPGPQNDGSPTELTPSTELPSSGPVNAPSADEASEQQAEQEAPSAPVVQPPSNDEPEPEPSSPPGSEQTSPGKLPPKTQDSHVIKIYPEPVSGVNGKFTLPGGIYIVSTSTDTPNNNQPKPVHPSAGEQVVGGVSPGDETIVGSKPIIIVTNPGPMSPPEAMMPQMPNFPSDFPPMGSQESPIPPIDESSLELQQRPVSSPQMPNNDNLSTPTIPSSSSSFAPEIPQSTVSSSSIVNDEQQQSVAETTTGNYMSYPSSGQPEVQITTNGPQQDEESVVGTTQSTVSTGADENPPQHDENDTPTITTIPPPQQQQPTEQAPTGGDISGVSIPTTNGPLSDDDDENDALTIIPINENPSEKSTGSTTPETLDVSGAEMATTLKSQSSGDVAGQEQQVPVSTVSSASLGIQEADSTTKQSPTVISGSEDAGSEATTIAESVQNQITTLRPDSEESDEDSEETRVTPGGEVEESDIQKTTLAPANNDFIAQTTVSSSTGNAETAPSGTEGNQDEEVLPGTTASSDQLFPEREATTVRVDPAQPEQVGVADSQGVSSPPESESTAPEMAYPTGTPPLGSIDAEIESQAPPKIILNPGSETVNGIGAPSDSAATASPVNDDAGQDENDINQVSETLQPFPVTSPAPTGEAGESEQQQLFPGSESSADQSEQESAPTTFPTASSNDQQQPFPGSEPDQSFPESSTIPAAPGDSQSDSGSEQSSTSIETGATSESSQTPDVGNAAGLPTTESPVSSDDIEQNSISGSEPSNDGESTNASGDKQTTSDGASSSSESSSVSSAGSDSVDPTSRPSGIPGSETVSDGTEPPSQGSESIASGTESPTSGNDPSLPGASIQGDDPLDPGSESLVSAEPATTTTESADGLDSPSQSSDLSDQGSEPSPASSSDNGESAAPEPVAAEQSEQQLPSVPSNDEPTSANDSESADNESAISSTTNPSAGGNAETESISQDHVPSIPSDAPEDASSVQGSSPQADSPVSPDNVQDPQPVVSTSEVPQDVSSPTPVESSPDTSSMHSPSTAAPIEPELPPQPAMPNYQILKACKFQSFFRSVNDMTYSYRHYPWLATIVGGTRPFSSGTLITDRHILTASHFLANITVSDVFNMRIHIGYRTSYSGQTEGPYAVRKVRKVIRHKGFSFEKLYNDIAVLVLDRPVRFSEDIYPVCISSNRTAYADGTAEAFETGWIEDPRAYTISQHHNYIDPHIQKYFSFGYKNITWRLQEAPQRVRTNTECQSNYSFLEKNGIMVTDSMVCAGSGDTRSCAFRGNSGAPLFLRNENDRMTEQIGIVSFGIGCGHFPFVFTRVESFLPWLDRVVYNSR